MYFFKIVCLVSKLLDGSGLMMVTLE